MGFGEVAADAPTRLRRSRYDPTRLALLGAALEALVGLAPLGDVTITFGTAGSLTACLYKRESDFPSGSLSESMLEPCIADLRYDCRDFADFQNCESPLSGTLLFSFKRPASAGFFCLSLKIKAQAAAITPKSVRQRKRLPMPEPPPESLAATAVAFGAAADATTGATGAVAAAAATAGAAVAAAVAAAGATDAAGAAGAAGVAGAVAAASGAGAVAVAAAGAGPAGAAGTAAGAAGATGAAVAATGGPVAGTCASSTRPLLSGREVLPVLPMTMAVEAGGSWMRRAGH